MNQNIRKIVKILNPQTWWTAAQYYASESQKRKLMLAGWRGLFALSVLIAGAACSAAYLAGVIFAPDTFMAPLIKAGTGLVNQSPALSSRETQLTIILWLSMLVLDQLAILAWVTYTDIGTWYQPTTQTGEIKTPAVNPRLRNIGIYLSLLSGSIMCTICTVNTAVAFGTDSALSRIHSSFIIAGFVVYLAARALLGYYNACATAQNKYQYLNLAICICTICTDIPVFVCAPLFNIAVGMWHVSVINFVVSTTIVMLYPWLEPGFKYFGYQRPIKNAVGAPKRLCTQTHGSRTKWPRVRWVAPSSLLE